MEFQKFLILIIGGIFASSLVIVVLFIIINACIRRKVGKYNTMALKQTKPSNNTESSFKHNGQEEARPPLPPRDQFDTESMSNSYEDMPENPLVADETSCLTSAVIRPPETQISFQDNISVSENYEEVDEQESATNSYEDVSENHVAPREFSAVSNPVIVLPPETQVDLQDNLSAADSYDDIDALQNAQNSYEDIISLPDYLEVEQAPFQNKSDSGSENYDDIDKLHSDEDYDDVG
ncbi:uncharacterized protein LOC124379150 [Silurus meridionalis]|nr:uncharacterized protein LOC124379150 [Silurus meridionalis]